MPRPVLLDLYYTLLAPDPDHHVWNQASANLLGIELSALEAASAPSFNDRMIGVLQTPEEVIDQLLVRLERTVSPAIYDQLVHNRWQYFHGLRLYLDVRPALTALRERGHRLGLVTNCSAETSVALERLELEQYFDALALSCEVGAAKPDPAIYQAAIDQLNIDPRTAVYVGDGDTQELEGAAAFGMTTVLVRRPIGPQRDVQADYTVSALTDLLDLPLWENR